MDRRISAEARKDELNGSSEIGAVTCKLRLVIGRSLSRYD